MERALSGLDADLRIALLHYSPIEATLEGERLEIYPFLGSYLLAEAVDNAGADLVLHGHAHHGAEKGRTPAGIPVTFIDAAGPADAYVTAVLLPIIGDIDALVLLLFPPEDATTLARASLSKLQGRIRAKLLAKTALDPTTKAHLQESLARINGALSAATQRKVD